MRRELTFVTVGLVALLLAVISTAQPVARGGKSDPPAASQPASQPASRAAAWKPTGRYRPLTVEQETELLNAVKQHKEQDYTRLQELAKKDPVQYRSLLRHMWAWYAEWKNLPPHVQQAYWTMRETKAETARLLAQIQADKTGTNREKLVAQLRHVQASEFDAGQVIHKQWAEEFSKRIDKLQAQIDTRRKSLEKMQNEFNERQKERQKILDAKVNVLLKKVPAKPTPAP
jgi:hypothetical protein